MANVQRHLGISHSLSRSVSQSGCIAPQWDIRSSYLISRAFFMGEQTDIRRSFKEPHRWQAQHEEHLKKKFRYWKWGSGDPRMTRCSSPWAWVSKSGAFRL